MDNVTLTALFEPERDRLLSEIEQNRTPDAVQTVLENAMDRLAIQYAEQCPDEKTRTAAQLTLRTIRQSLPLMDSVGEVRRWQREVSADRRGFSAASLLPLAGGIVLILAVMLGLMLSGGRIMGILTLVEALIPAALGGVALFWAGMKYAAPKAKPAEDGPVREEYLVDGDKIWHHLLGMLLAADSALEDLRVRASVEAHPASAVADIDALPRDEAELFSGLLESAYALDGPDAREMIERMRFYLHRAKVDVVDYDEEREAWFEVLPANRQATIRPALASGDRLICKGLAVK